MNNHGDRLDAMTEEREQARRESVQELLQDDGPMGQLMRHFLATTAPADNDSYMGQVNRICDDVTDMYKNTPATASECFQVLDDRLMEIDMEPDCVGLWQEFLVLKEEEEAWDDLSAHEQYRSTHVPKGKQRKPLHRYNLRRSNKSH